MDHPKFITSNQKENPLGHKGLISIPSLSILHLIRLNDEYASPYFLLLVILKKNVFMMFPKETTVKPVLIGHSKIDKTKVLKTNGSLRKVKNIA